MNPDSLVDLNTIVTVFAKEPPRQNSMLMRTFNQLFLDPDLAISRGSRTLTEELDKEGGSLTMTRPRTTSVEMPKWLESEQDRLKSRSWEVQVLLATWDLSRRVKVTRTKAGAAKLKLDGSLRRIVVAPNEHDLKKAVRKLIRFMKQPVCLDEIVFEAKGLDLAFPLDRNFLRLYTMLAIDVVTNVVSVPVHVIKHLLNVKRPHEVDGQVHHLIAVPGHASYPSGHAATTFALAVVLGAIMGATKDQQARLDCIADRISKNRERAGLHTRLDTKEGKKLGLLMGHWMVDVAQKADLKPQAWGVLFALAAQEWVLKPTAAS